MKHHINKIDIKNSLVINLTREGSQGLRDLINKSQLIHTILDANSSWTRNFYWGFDQKLNRNTYKLYLPKDKLDLLLFLFEAELNFKTCTHNFWNTHYTHCTNGKAHFASPHYQADKVCVMIKRIIKEIKNYKNKLNN
tara:strand:- start:905 stop:1318 length:414 start_codon:yes stop_codon:yes gene_type:complete